MGQRHLVTGCATPRVAEGHESYVYGPGQVAEAVDQLLGVTPTLVTSDRPLLRVTTREPHAELRIVPFQHPDTGRYLNILDGTQIELAPELIAALRRKVEANRRHFPREDTVAGSFGVPGLYVRLDCFLTAAESGPVSHTGDAHPARVASQWNRAEISICEFDDQPAFVGMFRRAAHTSAYQTFDRLAAELDLLGRPLGLAEYDEDPAFYTLDNYPHDERLWLPDIARSAEPDRVSAIVRARRQVAGTRRFLERWTTASIFPGAEFRDYKGVLGVPATVDRELGLGVLVQDHEVARDVVAMAHEYGRLAVVAKALFSARKEGAMAIWFRTKVPASYYRLNQLRRMSHGFDDGEPYLQPLVLQPAFRPPTLRDLNIRFTDHDAAAVLNHRYRARSGEVHTGASVFTHPPSPGNEHHFHGLFRLYFVYLPSENRGPAKRARFAGGLLQACTTPMAIHGSNGAVTVWVRAMQPESWPVVGTAIGDSRPWIDLARLPRFTRGSGKAVDHNDR